jgi:hypothetical protein
VIEARHLICEAREKPDDEGMLTIPAPKLTVDQAPGLELDLICRFIPAEPTTCRSQRHKA